MPSTDLVGVATGARTKEEDDDAWRALANKVPSFDTEGACADSAATNVVVEWLEMAMAMRYTRLALLNHLSHGLQQLRWR
jgi:hypothetical protein